MLLFSVALKLVPLLLMKLSLPLICSQNLPLLSCKHSKYEMVRISRHKEHFRKINAKILFKVM